MNLNMNFSQRSVVDSLSLPWQTTDSSQAKQRWIERVDEVNGQGNETGEAVMRTTRILQYAPGETLDAPLYNAEEEIIVLEGRFSDDQGDYGPGFFLMNPPGLPSVRISQTGCTLFVKQRLLGKTSYPNSSDCSRVAVDTGVPRPNRRKFQSSLFCSASQHLLTVLAQCAVRAKMPV
jgi:hypothetical protein